jgi:hypothetical protein
LFALAAATGFAFWMLDALMKGYQYRYYVRMHEIECTSYLINSVILGGEYLDVGTSAPRIDMTWGFKGSPVNKETGEPLPRPHGDGGAYLGARSLSRGTTGAPKNPSGGRRRGFAGICGTAGGGGTSCFRMSSRLLSG